MGHSSAVGFLAFALFLVACVSASTDASAGTDEAKKAVEEATNATKKICGRAESYIAITKGVLQRVDPFKKKAEVVNSRAAQALSQVDQKAKENAEAKSMVETIKNSANTVTTLYQSVTQELQNTVASLEKLLKDAEALKTECDKEIPIIARLEANHQEATNKAAALKTKEVELDKILNDTVKLMDGVDSTAKYMKQNLTKAEMENLHLSAIVDVAKIKTMIGKADGSIQETEEKKDKVSGIVKEMLNLKTNAPTESNEIIEPLYKSANDALINATRAFQHATNAKAMLTQLNGHADAALKDITAATDVRNAQKEVKIIEACVRNGQQITLQLQSALQTASDSLTNANDLQKKMMTALKITASNPRMEQSKETEEANLSLGERTAPGQEDKTIQPTIAETEQPKSKELIEQSNNNSKNPVQDTPDILEKSTTVNTTVKNAEQTVIETSSNSMHQASGKPVIVQRDQPKGENSEILKNTLRKGVQNITTLPLTGEKAPALDDKNDSAMTVSVPLLVALIAFAVWQ